MRANVINTKTGIAGLLAASFAAGAATAADQNDSRPDLEGVWKSTYVSLDDPRWRIEDLACRGWCTLAQFEYLQALLRDPENDNRAVKDLYYESEEFNEEYVLDLITPLALEHMQEYNPAESGALDCDPEGDGWRHQVSAPPPIEIEQQDDRVIIRYEYWNAERVVYTDGRDHPDNESPSRLGHSIGWYEGQTLVVETKNLTPDDLYLPRSSGQLLSNNITATERYTRSEDGERLDLVWSIFDPAYFKEPLRGQKSSLYEPNWELNDFVCEAITGEY
jgi:hypothetical protein